jgi:chemotaxis signal transduction protein
VSAVAMKMVGFEAAGRRFLVEVEEVREVLSLSAGEAGEAGDESEPVGPLDGWITVRGESLPVTDLRRRLGADAGDAAASAVLVLRHPSAGSVGVRVDRVMEVREMGDADLSPVPSYFGEAAPWIRGLVPDGVGFAVLVDGAALITADVARALVRR